MENGGGEGIRIAAVCGSVRPGNYTGKALALVADEIRRRPEIAFDLIEPVEFELALPGLAAAGDDPARLRRILTRATGIILATPEYHGSFSSVIKLVIENLGFPSALAGKPVALLGVAAGQVGAVKSLEALASICSHVGAIVLPGAVSVANVQKVFDVEGVIHDPVVEKRIRSVATNLIDYIHGAICPRIAMEAMARGQA